jgi:hypothetical protein
MRWASDFANSILLDRDPTLWQRLGRFVRETLSFSKSDAMHEICLLLFLHCYNKEKALAFM